MSIKKSSKRHSALKIEKVGNMKKIKFSKSIEKIKSKTEKRIKKERIKQMLMNGKVTLFLYILVFNLANKYICKPIAGFIWSLALNFSADNFIVTSNFKQMIVNPIILLALLIIFTGVAVTNLYQISGICTCMEYMYQKKDIGLKRLLYVSFKNMRILFADKSNFVLPFFALVIIPFTNFANASLMVNSLNVPEFIMEVIEATSRYRIIYWALMFVLYFFCIRWIFIFHYMLLEQMNLKEAAKASSRSIWRLGFRRSVGLVINRYLWMLGPIAAILLWSCVYMAFLEVLDHFFVADVSMAAYWVDHTLVEYILNLYYSCCEAFVGYAVITYYYHEYKNDCALSMVDLAQLEAPLYFNMKNRLLRKWFNRISMKIEWHLDEVDAKSGDMKMYFSSNKKHYFLLYRTVIALSMLVCVLAVYIISDFFPEEFVRDELINCDTGITCHRGYSAVAPENTLPAFQKAIESGCTEYGELDVQLTSDNVVVLSHDDSLLRCTGVNRRVDELTYADILKLDASKGYLGADAQKYRGTVIPTLDEVIKLCKGKIKLNIEIKGSQPDLVKETVKVIEDNDFLEECVVTSLKYEDLVKVKKINPKVKCGYILAIGVGNYYDLDCADFFSVEETSVTTRMLKELHKRGKEVHVWTVDRADNADELISMGVDNIITGDPILISERINRESLFSDYTLLKGYVKEIVDSVENYSGEDVEYTEELEDI